MGRTRVGIAGWDYPDWIGPVYPTSSRRGFDRLAYVAQFVDVIEINSTFYRPTTARVATSWVRRTAFRGDDFAFAAKSHRSWTHAVNFPEPVEIRATLDGLDPILQSGRLIALLVQFPQSFRHERSARDRVEWLAEQTVGWPIVVELRHASWQSDAAQEWFSTTGLAWCVVDQPRADAAVADARPRVTSRLAYLRLHGRNSQNWFRADAGRDERYDYRYSTGELKDLASTALAMQRSAEELVIVQNNHFRGQALANALELRHLLDGTRPAAPETLLATYPELEPAVSVRRTRLF